jgi:hypothetical protein
MERFKVALGGAWIGSAPLGLLGLPIHWQYAGALFGALLILWLDAFADLTAAGGEARP